MNQNIEAAPISVMAPPGEAKPTKGMPRQAVNKLAGAASGSMRRVEEKVASAASAVKKGVVETKDKVHISGRTVRRAVLASGTAVALAGMAAAGTSAAAPIDTHPSAYSQTDNEFMQNRGFSQDIHNDDPGTGENDQADSATVLNIDLLKDGKKSLAQGEWVNVLSKKDPNSLINPQNSTKDQVAEAEVLKKLVDSGQLKARGGVDNTAGGRDLFVVKKLIKFEINPDDVPIIIIEDKFGKQYGLGLQDLTVRPPLLYEGADSTYQIKLFEIGPNLYKDVIRETNRIKAGENTKYGYQISQTMFTSDNGDQDKRVAALSSQAIAESIAQYKFNVEENKTFQDMVSEVAPGILSATNKLAEATLNASDFNGGTLPVLTNGNIRDFMVISSNNFGGGLSGHPALLDGPYDDGQRLIDERDKAMKVFSKNVIHETLIHSELQEKSIYVSMTYPFTDTQSILTHESMGIWEYVGSRGAGLEGIYPSKRVLFIASRLIDGGMDPATVVRAIASVGVHGDHDGRLAAFYGEFRRSGDPTLAGLMAMDGDKLPGADIPAVNRFFRTASEMAGLSVPPPYDPTLVIPEYEGPSDNMVPFLNVESIQLQKSGEMMNH